MRWLLLLWLLCPVRAVACDIALLFAVDISGSVDPSEYRIQMEGLALALEDPEVAHALVEGRSALALLQWTGASRQRLTIPWTTIETAEGLSAFAEEVRADRRIWRNFSTAIGEALLAGAKAFEDAPNCARQVIDISGDGPSNEGSEPRATHAIMAHRGITVNAIVIEDATEGDLTGYYAANVITGPGSFLVTAEDYRDYPDRIRRKLLREVIQVIGRAVE